MDLFIICAYYVALGMATIALANRFRSKLL